MSELIARYNESGLLTMVLQEFVQWEDYVRCMCLGRSEVLVMKYDPINRRYLPQDLPPPLYDRIVADSLTLVRTLGYDMNTCEFAIKDGVPYAIDFTNPAPDFEVTSLTDHYFPFAVQKMADLCSDLALGKRQRAQARPLRLRGELERLLQCSPDEREASRECAEQDDADQEDE